MASRQQVAGDRAFHHRVPVGYDVIDYVAEAAA